MSLPIHVLDVPDALNGFTFTDRVIFGKLSLPYADGTAAGATVTTALPSLVELPAGAAFFVSAPAGVAGAVNGTPGTGLSLVIQPLVAGSTVAAGTASILVIA